MKIPVDRLTATPTPFHFEADASWWAAHLPEHGGLPGHLPEPLVFTLQAHCMGEDLFLEGRAEGALELECSRCLARYRHPLSEPFRLVLEPAAERVPADPEGAEALARDGLCLEDEVETGWYRGSEIHLGQFFLEVVALALPVKPLCRDDCPGLCPSCGAELAATSCGCAARKAESPFAVLASLRDELSGGKS